MADDTEPRKRVRRKPPRRWYDARALAQVAGLVAAAAYGGFDMYERWQRAQETKEMHAREIETAHAERRYEVERKYREAMEKLRQLEAGK